MELYFRFLFSKIFVGYLRGYNNIECYNLISMLKDYGSDEEFVCSCVCFFFCGIMLRVIVIFILFYGMWWDSRWFGKEGIEVINCL